MFEEVKKAGKFWIENELVDSDLKDISGNAFKILVTLARHYNRAGTCFPSIRRIARLTGLHHETATKCLRELELRGYFEQLVIRERCKLRYIFSKTARKLLIEPNNLLVKPDTKETVKEEMKDDPYAVGGTVTVGRLNAIRAELEAKGILRKKVKNE